ncbi:MAG: sporulation protein Cse60 [Nitrososphaeraceae archaeon]
MKRLILVQAFNATHPNSLSNQINDFLRENDIQKIIDLKYSSFKRDDNTNDYSALLIYLGLSEEQ